MTDDSLMLVENSGFLRLNFQVYQRSAAVFRPSPIYSIIPPFQVFPLSPPP